MSRPQSAERFHSRSVRRIPIEGDGVLTFRGMAAALNKAVGKVGLADRESAQGLPNQFRPLHDQLLTAQQRFQNAHDLVPLAPVATLEHPDQFHDHDQRDKSGRIGGERIQQFGRGGGLDGIVLGDVADDDIGVKTNHREAAPRRAMAAFICSMETALAGLRINPMRSCTGLVAATMANCPLPCSTNSTRSPASSPRALRTREGMVIWPFEVRVATAIVFAPILLTS